MIQITTAQIALALYKAIQKDQANRYSLLKDWTLPRLALTVQDYQGKLIVVKDSTITVRAYSGSTCNGCTLSPDEIGRWKPVIGALFHDPWYAELFEIAKAWGWSEALVRKLGDEIFACILVATGTPRWLARAYLTGLRAGGGIVRWINGLLGVTLLAMMFSGCSGCAIPNHFNDQPVTPPQYQETTNGTGPR